MIKDILFALKPHRNIQKKHIYIYIYLVNHVLICLVMLRTTGHLTFRE
jgi:hypothetical protein